MKIQNILDIISHLMEEKTLSEKEIYTYDVNKDGVVDKEDLISMWEAYAKDTSQPKFYTDGEVFNKNIRRLLTSDKYSEAEAEDITNRMSNISTQHITTTFNSSQDVAFKTEKASKLFAKKANIKKPTNSI